jgi:hypothetical protein
MDFEVYNKDDKGISTKPAETVGEDWGE